MMKKTIIFLFCLLFLTGCGENQAFDRGFSKGITATAKGQYEQALAYFSLAESLNPGDKELSRYQEQVEQLQHSTEEIAKGKLSAAKKIADQVVRNEKSSRIIKQKGSELLAEVADLEKQVDQVNDQINQLQELLTSGKRNEAIEQLVKIQKLDLTPAYLADEQTRVQQLTIQLVEQQAEKSEAVNDKPAVTTVKIPQELQQIWYDAPADDAQRQPIMEITETTVHFYYNDRFYTIRSFQQRMDEYILNWDMNLFAERYGPQALGNDPLPFQFFLTKDTHTAILQMGETTMYGEIK